MRTLKHLLLFACVLFIIPLTIDIHTAKADGETFARVTKNSIYIYQDSAFLKPMFAIPIGYYVKVEEYTSGTLRVSYGDGDYPKIYGYMKESEVLIVDYKPSTPYTVIKVSTDITDVLFGDAEMKTPYFNVPENEILYYYGEIAVSDKVMCFVYYLKKLGYVDKTSLNSFSIANNPDKLTPDKGSTEDYEQPPTQTDNKVNPLGEHLQVIIIVGISIVSISVVYFLFKPSKHKTDEEN